MNNLLPFEIFDQALRTAGSYIGAAEMHGLQSGLICGKKLVGTFEWEVALTKEVSCIKTNNVLLGHLNALYARTASQLQGTSFCFDLLLPKGEAGLINRARELANWCQGFICGLGLAGVQDGSISSKTAKEAIKDLSQIAHVHINNDELSDEHERDFFELVEHVKVAVQKIQIDLKIGKQIATLEKVLH